LKKFAFFKQLQACPPQLIGVAAVPCKGALTRGDRRAATGADLMEFNFDTPYGRTALRTLYAAICQVSSRTEIYTGWSRKHW